MLKVQQIHRLWQHLGPEWLAYRLSYAARMRTGSLRRKMPATSWAAQPLANFVKQSEAEGLEDYLKYRRLNGPAFLFSPADRTKCLDCLHQWDKQSTTPMDLVREISQGTLRYFEHTPGKIGFPPDWHMDPFTGQRAPKDLHWSEINDFGNGDIKVIWEPSRFAFVYLLVRAYWRTGDEQYAEMFWRLIADWRAHNQPQVGPNWKCGQEISFRVMAWCFGLYGFLEAERTSTSDVSSLAQMVAISGTRIEANIDYALSQYNNHGVSEASGLWTIGALFPEFQSSERWESAGRALLESLAQELIYEDGAFAQHSANYHRLMLHDYLWVLRLGEILNRPFSEELKERVCNAGEFLLQIQDNVSGKVPRYGPNDGALILPLNNCDYQDFRPVTQAIHYFKTGKRCHSAGPWDEDLLWLFGPEALNSETCEKHRVNLKADQGGCYTLRSRDGFAFIRCGEFRHRPSQADMLHVDLWWRGQNVALDAGTYSYNAPMPWNEPLSHTEYHNTVTVDSQDQMDRVGRFLWLPWSKGRVLSQWQSDSGHLAYWEGEHDGYKRLSIPATHRRAVIRIADHWLVLDRMTSPAQHDYRLHWLLMDAPYDWDEKERELVIRTPSGPYFVQIGTLDDQSNISIIRADNSSARGWRAPYYYYREAAVSLALTARASTLHTWTAFGPERCVIDSNEDGIRLGTDSWSVTARSRPHAITPRLVRSIHLKGAFEDRLEIS